jgi:hypothetical protein
MLAAGRSVTHFDVSEPFGRAYLSTQTGENVSGFRTTDIYPVNRNIFRCGFCSCRRISDKQ